MLSSSSSSSSSYIYGSNIVTNGNLNGNADGWTLSGGIKYENYSLVAEPVGSYIKRALQFLPTIIGEKYLVQYTVKISGVGYSSFSLGNQYIDHGSNEGVVAAIVRIEDEQPLIINVVVTSGKISITNVKVKKLLVELSSSSYSSSSRSTSSFLSTSSTKYFLSSISSASSVSSSSAILSTSSSISSQSSSSISSYSSSSVSSSSISSISSSSMSSISSSSKSSSSVSSVSLSSASTSSVSSFSSASSSSISSSSFSSSSVSSSSRSSFSSSSQTSSSSSSSLYKGYYSIPFNFDITDGKQIWCFVRHENYVYTGTGPNGEILRSKDYYNWEKFQSVEDQHVKSMYVWANGLFIGTQPHGKIYTYNFTTNKFYHFVQTEDSCITCFTEYKGKLYAGTAPIGLIYCFDKNKWERLQKISGSGVSCMSVFNNILYIFAYNNEIGLTYDGDSWNLIKVKNIALQYEQNSLSESSLSSSSSELFSLSDISSATTKSPLFISRKESQETFASFKNSKYEPLLNSKNKFINRSQFTVMEEELAKGILKAGEEYLVIPQIGTKSILTSCASSSKLYMGSDNGIIFEYPDVNKNINILYQIGNGNINKIIMIDDNTLIISIDNKLYLIKNE